MRAPSDGIQIIMAFGIAGAFAVLWFVIDRGVDWLVPKGKNDPRR